MPQTSSAYPPEDLAAKLQDHHHHLKTLSGEVSNIVKLGSFDRLPYDELTASSLDSWSPSSISQGLTTTDKPSTIPTSLPEPEADDMLLEGIISNQAVRDSDLSSQSSASSADLPGLKGYVFDDAAVEGVGDTWWGENERDTKQDPQDILAIQDEEREAVLARLDPFLC